MTLQLERLRRDINEILREGGDTDAYVWIYYNSGDPICRSDPHMPEMCVFADKAIALRFIRGLLKNELGKDVDGLSDQEVEAAMWNDNEDLYLHLYEMRVHTGPP